MEWEQRLSDLWASFDDLTQEAFMARMDDLAAELPADNPLALFERASAFDLTGQSDRAVPLYRQALKNELKGVRRRQAVIQLASSLRNLGQVSESLALLSAEQMASSDELDDAVSAFLALALADEGREREALALVLTTLAPHLPRYQRSVANYARLLAGSEGS